MEPQAAMQGKTQEPGIPAVGSLSSGHHDAKSKGSGIGCVYEAEMGTPVLGGQWQGWMQQSCPNTHSRFFTPHPAFSGGYKYLP